MAQIFSLLLMASSLAGLGILLTRKTKRQRWMTVAGLLGILATLLIVASFFGIAADRMFSFLASFLIIAGIYSVLTLGLNIQWGYTGLFNIGVAGFFGVGAYVSTILVQSSANVPTREGLSSIVTYFGLPFPVGLVAAMVVSGIVALVVGLATLRLRTDYLAIATIGISEILRLIISNESWLTEGTRGISNIPQPLHGLLVQSVENPNALLSPPQYNWFYVLIVLFAIFILYVALELVARSPWGRTLRAIREDEDAAQSYGKNTFRFRLQAFILGAVIMGAAGSLYAHFLKFIDPQIFDPVSRTFLVWVMLIVGGTGNNRGAIFGAFLMWGVWSSTGFLSGVLPPILMTPFGKINVAAQLFGPIRIMVIVVILQLILLYRPRGILGEERQTSSMAGKTAKDS